MLAVLALAAALVGLAAGSFLNQVIERVPRRQALLRPGPRCPTCETPLGVVEVLPLIAWLRSGRSCRHCQAPIPVRYPLVELATAAVFATVAVRFEGEAVTPAFLVFGAVLVAVTVIDLRHYIVPNRIVSWSLYLGVPLLAAAAAIDDDWDGFFDALVGGVGGFVFLLVVHLVQPRGMGMGDVKLAAVLGLHLGWQGPGHVFLGLFLGFLYGAVIGLLLIVTRLRSRKDPVPFAPFLAVGAFTALIFGRALLDWYLG